MESTADGIFRIVPSQDMPPGERVVYVEVDGQPRWLLSDSTPLPDLVNEMNHIATHLVRHGLWAAQRHEHMPPRLRHVS